MSTPRSRIEDLLGSSETVALLAAVDLAVHVFDPAVVVDRVQRLAYCEGVRDGLRLALKVHDGASTDDAVTELVTESGLRRDRGQS